MEVNYQALLLLGFSLLLQQNVDEAWHAHIALKGEAMNDLRTPANQNPCVCGLHFLKCPLFRLKIWCNGKVRQLCDETARKKIYIKKKTW